MMEQFKAEMRAFLQETGMAKTTFSREVSGSPSFYDRVMGSNDMLVSTMEHVREYMDGRRREHGARKVS